MDNWVTFLLVNVVLAVIVGIITNLVTPWVKSTYETSIFSSRKKRIERLIKDYQIMKDYRNNYSFFLVYLMGPITVMIGFAGLITLVLGMEMIEWKYRGILPSHIFYATDNPLFQASLPVFSFYLYFLLMIFMMFLLIKKIRSVLSFDDYTKKTTAKIKKLGGNPEELAKIDKEIEAIG